MRPLPLVIQVTVAAMSAAIGRAFAPRCHLAKFQHVSSSCGRRLSNSGRGRIAWTAQQHQQHQQQAATMEGGRYRGLLLFRPGSGAPRLDGSGCRGQAALLPVVGVRGQSSSSRRSLLSLPSHHDGGWGINGGMGRKGSSSRPPAVDSRSSSRSSSSSSSRSNKDRRSANMPVAALGDGSDGNDSSGKISGDQEGFESDVDDLLTQGGVDSSSRLHAAAALDDELNESQRSAVFAEVGAVRVVAGPGSGKTRVLTRRIAHLVRNIGAPAWSILAVTFTKKASEEMRIRVRKALGEEVSGQVALGTFHSVCARLLRRHGDALPAVVSGLDGRFSIFDTEDSRRLLTEIINDLGLDVKEVKPTMMRSSISKLKSQGLRPEDIRVESKGPVGGATKRVKMVAEIYRKYQQRLVQNNAMDFDDLILVALRLLRQDKEVSQAVGRQYRHVLVDEWQDTNGPQYELVIEIVRAGREAQLAREENRRAREESWRRQMAGESTAGEENPHAEAMAPPPLPPPPPPSIFVVGDTDQCIYKFRGADYTNVARFVEDFQGCQTVLLRENYRSTANIARAATAVIGQVSDRASQSTIATTAVQGDGLPIGVMVCDDAAGEAEAVAHHLELYWTSGRVPPSEMAVMYRTNAQSRSFEEACVRKALPFVVVGAQRFYERREVKDCLVYLRLAANPRDAVAMRRAINTPTRGIGPKTEQALEILADSARSTIPGLEDITVPECLMSLLQTRDLDELEKVLAASLCGTGEPETGGGITAAASGAAAPASPQEGTLGGGVGLWPEESDDPAAFTAANGGREDDGWRGFSVPRVKALREALSERPDDLQGPPKGQATKLRVFAKLLCRLRVVSASEGVPELLGVVLKETGMHKHVTETLAVTGPAEGEDRWQNVMELERAASNPKFSGVAGEGALVSFLNEVALLGGDDPEQARKQREEEEAAAAAVVGGGGGGAKGGPAPGEAVRPPMIQLMTIHASKGLEFDTVFVAGCEDGTLPVINNTKDELDEERRLMYVGMTRAKARLFLSWRLKRMVFGPGGAQFKDADRSRFIDDIPRDIIRTIDKRAVVSESPGNGRGQKHAYGGSGGGSSGRPKSSRQRSAYGSGGERSGGADAYSAASSYGDSEGVKKRVTKGVRGGDRQPEPEHDPAMDFLTEISNDASREASARRSRGGRGGGYGSAYGSGHGGVRPARGGRGGGGGAGRTGQAYGDGGGWGGGRSYESQSSRDAGVFMEKRDKAEAARYPISAVRDGGKRIARDAGEGVDTSWAAKLVAAGPKTPQLPDGVVVGAQVSHPIHGPGQVIALVEGSEGVNVRFVNKGQPFVTRVLGSKVKLLD